MTGIPVAAPDTGRYAGADFYRFQAGEYRQSFHPDLPPSALHCGADAVLTSTHKLAGSLTQSAILHLGDSDRVDEARLARAMRITRSTSPNSLLLASLDAARRQLAVHGEQLLHETLGALPAARDKLRAIEGVGLLDDALVGQPGIAAYDPLRVVLDVRGTGRTGLELRDGLRQSYDDHIELATQSTMVFIIGMGETEATLLRMAGDVEEVVARMRRPGVQTQPILAPVEPPVMAVSPREAFLGDAEQVAVEDAVGRISCESIAGYPPGIPAILPGERMTAEIARYLRETLDSGGRLHGSSDPGFRTIHVLREG